MNENNKNIKWEMMLDFCILCLIAQRLLTLLALCLKTAWLFLSAFAVMRGSGRGQIMRVSCSGSLFESPPPSASAKWHKSFMNAARFYENDCPANYWIVSVMRWSKIGPIIVLLNGWGPGLHYLIWLEYLFTPLFRNPRNDILFLGFDIC